jgi:O-antigen/teichoic acid export membrane protein/peptidoglycan/xylan/chitin deacetylase (PgdA/CDA1 family)
MKLFHFLRRNEIIILMLHGVDNDSKNENSWAPLRTNISKAHLNKALNILAEKYNFVSMADAVSMLEGKTEIKPYSMVISFDDGYQNNITNALPVLKKYKIPAIFFLTTDNVETQAPYWFDRLDFALQSLTPEFLEKLDLPILSALDFSDRKSLQKSYKKFLSTYRTSSENDILFLENIHSQIQQIEHLTGRTIPERNNKTENLVDIMTWDAARKIEKYGITIGSHTVDHLKLDCLDENIIQNQLQKSKTDIEEKLNKPCDYLCYPYGNFDNQVKDIARKCHYRAAVSTITGSNKCKDDLLALHRLSLPANKSKYYILAATCGLLNKIESKKIFTRSASRKLKNLFPKTFSKPEKQADIAGKNTNTPPVKSGKGLIKNVLTGWGAQLIYLVAGFILPRMIDGEMGKEALGVWDFSWSLIAYFGLIQAGFVSSVNRYVAKYLAVEDSKNLNISVSSASFVLFLMGLGVVGLTLASCWLIPELMEKTLANHLYQVQGVVFWLGISVSVQVATACYGGVLAGCSRWDIHHTINASSRLATLLGMILVLLFKGDLVQLAFVYFLCESSVLSMRIYWAHRICNVLRIRPGFIKWKTTKDMLSFGGKTFLPTLGDLFSNQTIGLLIVWFMGPEALALYARPRSLIRHIQTFMVRYAFVFTPTASAMQAKDDTSGIQKLIIDSSRYGSYIAIPILSFLAIWGGPLLLLWMGKEYADQLLVLVMVLGYLPVLIMLPCGSILRGLNLHGPPGVIRFLAATMGVCGALLIFTIFKVNNPTIWVVIMATLPLWLAQGLYVPYYAKKKSGLSLVQFFREIIWKPFLYCTPTIICLIISRMYFAKMPVFSFIMGISIAIIILFIIYWKLVFPWSIKDGIKDKRDKILKKFFKLKT